MATPIFTTQAEQCVPAKQTESPESLRSFAKAPVSATASSEQLPGGVRIDEANLGLVLDVELNVLLRFGQRQLSLREVLDLSCGSVIELDRRVDEPVELLLDGRVIARGEAAIVDGNYGLRISEIVLPMAPTQL
jgi:flagellar motor switch protein FliN